MFDKIIEVVRTTDEILLGNGFNERYKIEDSFVVSDIVKDLETTDQDAIIKRLREVIVQKIVTEKIIDRKFVILDTRSNKINMSTIVCSVKVPEEEQTTFDILCMVASEDMLTIRLLNNIDCSKFLSKDYKLMLTNDEGITYIDANLLDIKTCINNDTYISFTLGFDISATSILFIATNIFNVKKIVFVEK